MLIYFCNTALQND